MRNYVTGLVSVVIPTYKRSDMLSRAIKSVLDQTYSNIEVYVVNDNNTGDEYSKKLYDVMSSFNDERLHLVEQEQHVNGAVARNVGIRESRGEYISFLDDDDTWEPNKIERQIKQIEVLDESWGGVSCLKKYYRNGDCYRASLPYKDGYIFESVLLFLTDISMGAILIRREALDDAGYFDEKLLRAQDIQLFAFLSKKYKIKLLKEHLYSIDASDASNRPSLDNLKELRLKYAQSVDCLLENQKDLKRKLFQHITCGAGISMLRSGKILKGMAEIAKTLNHPSVFFSQWKMYCYKVCETIFAKSIIKRYERY